MNCKFCQAELEEGVTLCPACGQENQPEEELPVAEVTEEEAAEETVGEVTEAVAEEAPARKKLTSGKLAVIYICIIAILAALIAPIIMEMQEDKIPVSSTAGTIPDNGNKDDVTCKGSYTVSEKKAKDKADKVVATAGDAELTNEMLQSIYWMQVYNFLSNYGTYGMDTTKPLDRQVCAASEEGWTWQQYFLNVALQEWQLYNAFCQEGEAVGYEFTVDVEAVLEETRKGLEEAVAYEGFANVEQMIQYDMGPGATLDGYMQFLALMEKGYDYSAYLYEELVPTEDQIRAYYEENLALFEERGIADDGSVFVDVRHILLQPADKANEQDWAEAEKKAQEILDQWLAGDADEASFAALANEHSSDGGSNTNGGLYEYVLTGDMVEEFDAWCFDESRESGDYGIVKTVHGYHIMFFVKSQPVWHVYAANAAKSQLLNDTMAALLEKYPAKINYSKIVLGEAVYISTY